MPFLIRQPERLPYNVVVDVKTTREALPERSDSNSPANTYNSSFLCFAGAQENFPARAKREHFAVCTIGFARETAATSMPDEPVTP